MHLPCTFSSFLLRPYIEATEHSGAELLVGVPIITTPITCMAVECEDDDIGMHVASDLPTPMNIECMGQNSKENVSSGSNEKEEKT